MPASKARMDRKRAYRVFPGRPDQVGPARSFVAAALGRGAPAREVAALLTSEAVTNAVLHTASGHEEGTLTVEYVLTDGTLRVEVRDGGAPTEPRRRVHHVESVTGRGLDLFDALCHRWGVEGGPDGRVVWFELDVHHEEVGDGAGGGPVRPGTPRSEQGPLRSGPAGGPAARSAARHPAA
ncbi:MAG TPA: ATP-binding protein [Actinomycetes bacterium]|nr:ATP-binding protein [Actinomycetes bacterium]